MIAGKYKFKAINDPEIEDSSDVYKLSTKVRSIKCLSRLLFNGLLKPVIVFDGSKHGGKKRKINLQSINDATLE